MASREILGLFFILFFTCLFLSSTALRLRNLFPANSDHNLRVAEQNKLDCIDGNGRSHIAHINKFAHGGASHGTGGHGGGSSGATESGSGNGNGQDAGGAIPVIVAGAASNHHPNNRHSAASRNHIHAPTFIVIIWVPVIALYMV